MKTHERHPSGKKVANGLVALSSAAVFSVYSAGYLRTRSAAERFEDEARRPVVPVPARETASTAPRAIEPALAKTTPPPAIAVLAPASAPNQPAGIKIPHLAEPAPAVAAPAPAAPVELASAASLPTAPLTAPAAALPATNADTKTADAPAAPASAPLPKYKDGTYFGWGTSRHGDIQAYVIIEGGYITTAAIAQCLTRYSCSWIAHLPGQVIGRQSADVDYVTGATQSTNAFYYAIVEALSKAKVTTDVLVRSEVLMGTVVTIHVVGHGQSPSEAAGRDAAVARAFGWFERIEACCTRFEPTSELMQLTARIGVAVPVSAILFEAVQFAIAVAEESGGAFDPAVGASMEARGFDREYRTGRLVHTPIAAPAHATYRDVVLDAERRTVKLERPLILDLGGVAKGLAIDTAARELQPFDDFAIDAGGDLYLGGRNAGGAPWSVGIRHPRVDRQVIETLRVSDKAVCTSGDYERRGDDEIGHHILDPRTGASANASASVTVVAPSAMLADALATAAFVMGPADGLDFLERHGVDAVIFSPSLERHATPGMAGE